MEVRNEISKKTQKQYTEAHILRNQQKYFFSNREFNFRVWTWLLTVDVDLFDVIKETSLQAFTFNPPTATELLPLNQNFNFFVLSAIL